MLVLRFKVWLHLVHLDDVGQEVSEFFLDLSISIWLKSHYLVLKFLDPYDFLPHTLVVLLKALIHSIIVLVSNDHVGKLRVENLVTNCGVLFFDQVNKVI